MTDSIRMLIAIAGGFALSFVGFGILWAGAPWHFQALMFFPFAALAFATSCFSSAPNRHFLSVILGAAPLGTLLLMFRDKSGSHLMPVLIATSWLAGCLAGYGLALWLRKYR